MPTDLNAVKGMLNNNIKSAGGRVSNDLLKKAASIVDNRSDLY
jgi:hypothetical protein